MIWIALVAAALVAAGAWFLAKSRMTRIVVSAAAVAGVGAYWFIGKPGMPDNPLAGRLAELEAQALRDPEDINAAQALAILQDRAKKDPENPEPHKAMGDLFVAVGRPSEAMLSYQAALRRDPGYAPALDAVSELQFRDSGEVDAVTLARMGEIRDRARTSPESLTSVQLVALLNERVADAPEDATAYRMLGDLYQGAGHVAKAEAAYRDALARAPQDKDTYRSLADMRFKSTSKVDPETRDFYRRAFELDPSDLRVGYMAGVGDWQAGDRAQAEALWARIEAQTPDGDPRRQMFQAIRETFATDGANPAESPSPAP